MIEQYEYLKAQDLQSKMKTLLDLMFRFDKELTQSIWRSQDKSRESQLELRFQRSRGDDWNRDLCIFFVSRAEQMIGEQISTKSQISYLSEPSR